MDRIIGGLKYSIGISSYVVINTFNRLILVFVAVGNILDIIFKKL